MTIIYFILWCLTAILDGIRDGYMYHMRNTNIKTKINEHFIFTAHRLFPLLMVGFFEWILLLPAIFVFPFFHDGAYYMTRDVLHPGVYPFRWLDQSYSSTAKLTKIFTPINRVIAAAIGILIFIHYYIFGIL